MIELSTIRDLVAIFGVIAGFSYYVLTVRTNQKNQEISLRNQEQTLKTRHATIYHQVVAPTLSLTGIKNFLVIEENPVSSYEEWVEAISSNPEWFVAWSWLCMQYEMGGVYLRKGVADVEFFALHQSFGQIRFWRQTKPIIHKHREMVGPSYYRNMEYLFDSMEKYFEEHPEQAP